MPRRVCVHCAPYASTCFGVGFDVACNIKINGKWLKLNTGYKLHVAAAVALSILFFEEEILECQQTRSSISTINALIFKEQHLVEMITCHLKQKNNQNIRNFGGENYLKQRTEEMACNVYKQSWYAWSHDRQCFIGSSVLGSISCQASLLRLISFWARINNSYNKIITASSSIRMQKNYQGVAFSLSHSPHFILSLFYSYPLCSFRITHRFDFGLVRLVLVKISVEAFSSPFRVRLLANLSIWLVYNWTYRTQYFSFFLDDRTKSSYTSINTSSIAHSEWRNIVRNQRCFSRVDLNEWVNLLASTQPRWYREVEYAPLPKCQWQNSSDQYSP